MIQLRSNLSIYKIQVSALTREGLIVWTYDNDPVPLNGDGPTDTSYISHHTKQYD